MAVVHSWHEAHPFTCRDSQAVLDSSETDRDFYDGLTTTLLFMTGLMELWPSQALRIMIHCVDRFLPDVGPESVLVDSKRIAVDPAASMQQLVKQIATLRRFWSGRKTPDHYQKEILLNVMLWRVWDPAIDRRELVRYFGRISVRLSQYLNQTQGRKDGEERIVRYMKEIYPFESWLRGIQASLDRDNIDPDYTAQLVGV